jgi:hypothetical protein
MEDYKILYEGKDDNGFALLLKTANSYEAYIIKTKLLDAGVECFVSSDLIPDILPYLSNSNGGSIGIYVNKSDSEDALAILNDKIESPELTVHCPKCNSKNVRIRWNFIFFIKLIIIFLASIFFVFLAPFRKKLNYRCNDCGTTFKIDSNP